jgi:lipopolysaccharide biosynthesis protein
MRSVCLFSSYSSSQNIADYIQIYLEELQNYFEKIVFITNERTLSHDAIEWLKIKGIECLLVKNEGFDFGMWYKAMQVYDCSVYDKVALVNDSCVLYKPLTGVFSWINANDYDYCGLVSSARYAYHIQSYFILMNRRAFVMVYEFMIKTGIVNNYGQVIQSYEIGMNQYLLKNGLKLGAMYETITLNCPNNPSFYLVPQLIKEGIPLIKKKILFKTYRRGEYWGLVLMNFNIDERLYIHLIEEANRKHLLVNFESVLAEQGAKRKTYVIILIGVMQKIVSFLKQFAFMRVLYRIAIKIKRRLIGRL